MGRMKDLLIDQINEQYIPDPYMEWYYHASNFPVTIIDEYGNSKETKLDLIKHKDIIFQFYVDDNLCFYVSMLDDTQFLADPIIKFYTNVKE